jgi:hypothetical protein
MAQGFTQPVTGMSTGRFLGVKSSQLVRLTMKQTSVSRLSGRCGILDISQPQRPPWPVTAIALLFFFFFCVVFMVCNVSFIVCVALCVILCDVHIFMCYVLL